MNADQKRNYNQYMERYAESEARDLRSVLLSDQMLPKNRSISSIPLCREWEQIAGCFATLEVAAETTPAIVIFIVNNRASADDSLKKDNQETLAFLLGKGRPVHLTEHVFLSQVSESLSILIVDRASPG